MDLGLTGKVALVTGASTGLGYGIAQALAAEGAQVAIASRSRERINEAARSIPGSAGFCHDMRDVDAAPSLIAAVERRFGPLDILILNTGGPPVADDPLTVAPELWRDAYESLLLGSIALVQAAVPSMAERGWGRVVSVSSTTVHEPIHNLVLSTAHRAGLLAALKTYARQVAPHGVTINTLVTGRIATDRIANNYGTLEDAQRVAAVDVPAGRLGTVEEYAAVAAFMCSERAAYVTGTALPVDGGLMQSV